MNVNIQRAEASFSHYENGLQHLLGELKRIDLLIFQQIQEVRMNRGKSPADDYRGLFISEEEISEILKEKGDPNEDHPVFLETSEKINEHLQELNTCISQSLTLSLERGIFLPLQHLSNLFQLSSFERDCILICLAPELDVKYEKLYAYLNDDVTRKKPTIDLILKLLCLSIGEKARQRRSFSENSALFKYHLVQLASDPQQQQSPLISRSIKLDDGIVEFLLGNPLVRPQMSHISMLVEPLEYIANIIFEEEVEEKIKHLLQLRNERSGQAIILPQLGCQIFNITGPANNGQQQFAEMFCKQLQLPLLVVDTVLLLEGEGTFTTTLTLVFREALLRSAAVFFKRFDRLLNDSDKNKSRVSLFIKTLQNFHLSVFIETERNWRPASGDCPLSVIPIGLPIPSYEIRKKLWKNHLQEYSLSQDVDISELAGKFQFARGQIRKAIQNTIDLLFTTDSGKPVITPKILYEGCRAASNQKLSTLSKKIKPRYELKDIVLPKDKFDQLKEILSYVKYRQRVYGDWGFDKKFSLGKGLNALFHGPSGCGKTMASEIIANELGLDLYKIDLSTVVSKYIGETEKNLSRIFKEAETSNAIIFFDEADAIFGKRSEVKDAHDRYANIEVAYLLQKMEEYEGVVILATNLLKNMDNAFVRRLHFSVEFPFPGDEQRIKIWKTIFPEEAPRDADIDYEFLARKFKLAGGNIKNIIISSAFLALENSAGEISMKHIIMASKREFQKMGKLITQSDFGKYYHLIAS